MDGSSMKRRLVRYGMACMLSSSLLSLQATAQQGGDYYEDALRRFDAKDVQGAIVQLKNALQQNPKLLPAQVLLADAYLAASLPAAAEAALEGAERLGADRAVTAPRFALVYARQFKFKILLDRVNPQGLPPAEAAKVQIHRAAAHMALGNGKEAERALLEAEKLDPDLAGVRIARGNLLLYQNNLSGAKTLAGRIVAAEPKNADAWNLRASVDHLAGDAQAALAGYAKVLDIDPGYLDALVARAGLLVDIKRMDEADRDIKVLEKYAAADPRAAYLVSLSAARRGEAEAARKALVQATAILDPLPPEVISRNAQLLMLGGLAHYGLGEPEKAQGYLRGYIALQPRQAGARKLLASILLVRGDYREVIQLLYPLSEGAAVDPQVLSMMGSAYLGRKQYVQAADLFEQATKLAPGFADAAVGLGLTQMGAGQVGEGMAELERVFARDPSQTRAGTVLANAYLRQGEPAKAIEILRKIEAKEPANLVAMNMLGTALLVSKDAKGAQAAFTRAAIKDRNFLPVQFNIVRLDMTEGRRDAARKRLDTILKFNADHPTGLFLMAQLEEAGGRLGESIRLLERVRAGTQKPMGPLLYLVDIYLRQGNTPKALSVAQDLAAVYPDSLPVLETLGRSYQAEGSVGKARATFNLMSRNAGFNSVALTRVARLLMGVGAFDDAGHALTKALSNDATYLPAQIASVELDLRAGRLAAAERRALELRAAHGNSPAAARLLGSVYMAENKAAAAIPEFKAVLARERNGANTLALFQAYLAAGEGKAAIELVQTWMKDFPQDVAAEAALAEAYMRLGDLFAARTAYQGYVQKRPKDVGALNNLANIALKLNDPQALTYAQQAQALAPDDANVADTLGWVLVRQGQAQKALPYLRDARLRAARNPVIQYHLGVALHELGRVSEARAELRGAVSASSEFEGKDEARAILKQL